VESAMKGEMHLYNQYDRQSKMLRLRNEGVLWEADSDSSKSISTTAGAWT